VGVRGHRPGGPDETFTAGCVVGADGRFSLVARLAGAATLHEEATVPTTLYYAYWRNVAPYDAAGPAVYVYGPGAGYGFLLMESADGLTCVCVEGQSALLEPGEQKVEAFYEQLLQRHPRVARRLAGATRATKVHGMRKVGNLYRTAGGPGWALVGDALHQKDPLDGQGIYDAVFTAKALGQALAAWQRGSVSWEAALAQYEAAVHAETFPMYQVTMARVKDEVYTARPAWAFRSVLRWIMDDPEYKRRLGLLLVRGLAPSGWLPRRVLFGALLRGAVGDLGRWLTRRPRANALPSVPTPGLGYSR
jgi:flavin-dependent dehydrogenase